jgi:hypothetical protein
MITRKETVLEILCTKRVATQVFSSSTEYSTAVEQNSVRVGNNTWKKEYVQKNSCDVMSEKSFDNRRSILVEAKLRIGTSDVLAQLPRPRTLCDRGYSDIPASTCMNGCADLKTHKTDPEDVRVCQILQSLYAKICV